MAGSPAAEADSLERSVLNVSYAELRLEILKAWRLPGPLSQLISGQAGLDSPRVHNVRLALWAAREGQTEWESAALAEVVREIGSFLQLGLQATWSLLKNVERLEG